MYGNQRPGYYVHDPPRHVASIHSDRGDFATLDEENARYGYDRRDRENLIRDHGGTRGQARSRDFGANSGDRYSDMDRIELQDRDMYRYDQRRDDRNASAIDIEEFPMHDQRKTAWYGDGEKEGGQFNAGFVEDIEPDYDDENGDDKHQDLSDSDDEMYKQVSGFERTSKYISSDTNEPKGGVQKHMHSRDGDYIEGENYIHPVPDYGETARGEGDHRFKDDVSDAGSNDSIYRPRQYGKLLHKRSTRRLRRRSRVEEGNTENARGMSYADAVKTLVNSRRARSMVVSGPASVHGEDEYDVAPCDYNEGNDDKLPSNRHRKTERLAQRMQNMMKKREVTTHDMATALRDQILSKEPSLLTGPALWKYQVTMQWLRFKNWTKNWIYQLELWAGAFKQIEGQFGTATMTYFRFLRWLMFLNLFLALFMILVILVPFLSLKPSSHHDFPKSVNRCASVHHYEAVYFSDNYTKHVQREVDAESTGDYVLDVLQGTGWLENTELFYGIYFNKTARIPGQSPYTYNMSLAYLCAVGIGFLLSFILLVKNSAKGMKQSTVATGGSSITLFCNKVFGAWDFCISQDKTAHLKEKNIYQDLLNELEFQRLQWKKASRTTKERVKLYGIRLLIHLVVFVILSGSLYLIYFTNEQLLKLKDDKSIDSVVQLLMQYLPSITITLLNVIVPFIFNKVTLAEDYMPAFTTRITLFRIVLLRLASLGILMLSLYNTLDKQTSLHSLEVHCDNLHPPLNQTTAEPPSGNSSTAILCWETYVGQQIYKLVILNFLVVVSVTFIWEFPRKLMYDKLHKKFKVVDILGQQQFDLSKSVLDLIYLQALCWLGMFFSPLIPAMCCFKLFIFFYIKKGSLLHNCLPVQQYGTSRSNSLFMMVLLMAFALACIPIAFMVGSIQPSKGCGPFRVYSDDSFVMFNVVSNLIYSWEGVRDFLPTVAEGRVLVLIGFLLCLLMYYFYVVGQAHHRMTKKLREQLKVEGQDKQFLLARVNEAYAMEEQIKNMEDM